MPITSEFPPSTSSAVDNVYDTLHPLFFPSPEDHVQPILDSFVNTHDKVLDDETIFSARARLREAGVEVDAVLRECRRLDSQAPRPASHSEDRIRLDEVKSIRLRSRLHSVCVLTYWKRILVRLSSADHAEAELNEICFISM